MRKSGKLTDHIYFVCRTSLYPPAKRSFSAVSCFEHVRHSVLLIPSTFKVFAL